jgi:REP element-mobilizing transposase RayT
VAWLPVFCYPRFAEVIFDSWRFLQQDRQIDILACVLMEKHVHWIAVGPQLSRRVGVFKSFTATTILARMREEKYTTLLQELKHYKLRQKVKYTHYDPVRRGYVHDPVHWGYSSARQYAGQFGLLEVREDWL